MIVGFPLPINFICWPWHIQSNINGNSPLKIVIKGKYTRNARSYTLWLFNYWIWPICGWFTDDLPIKNGDSPVRYVRVVFGMFHFDSSKWSPVSGFDDVNLAEMCLHLQAGSTIIFSSNPLSVADRYPLVNKHSYWTWSFIADLPIKNGDFP